MLLKIVLKFYRDKMKIEIVRHFMSKTENSIYLYILEI